MFEFEYEHIPDVDAYLKRIDYNGTKEPTLENLHELVYCHQLTVPFECLNGSLYHLPVTLGVEDLYRKVVLERRGGYCFELNGLFVALLRDLGYNAWSVMCRVCFPTTTTLGGVMHRGTVIEIDDQRYFCDVGLGTAMASFAVKISEEKQTIHGETYWIEPTEMGWHLLKRMRGVGYAETGEGDYESAPVTIFGEQAFLAKDFETMNAATSSPDSFFSRFPQVNLRTRTGFKGYRNGVLTEMRDGVKLLTDIGPEDFEPMLEREFGIVAPEVRY